MDFNHLITLEEIENVFHKRKKKRKLLFISFLKYLAAFLILTILIFVFLNFKAYFKKTQFAANPDQFNQLKNLPQNQDNKLANLVLPTLYPSSLTDNSLYIPKISVKTPIIWGVKETEIMDQLKGGVAQYVGTALPGQDGRIFIFGHSSNYWWVKSDYNEIFALLDKIENGDNLYITYKGKEYIYQVYEKKVVRPSDVDVMNPTDYPTLSVMTCVPIGTSLNRLVISAKQTSPKANQEAETVLPNTLLPTK